MSAAPEYTVLVAVTSTGQVVDQINWSDWNFTDTLAWGSPGSMTVTSQLLGRDVLGPINLSVLRSIRNAGPAFSLCLVRDGRALFAGPVATMTWNSDQVVIGCTSLGKLFDRRMVIADPYYATPLDVRGNIHLELSLRDRALELLARATTGASRGLPLTIPAQSGLGGDPIDYLAADLATVYDRIREASEADGGPDIFFTPSVALDMSTIGWVANVGNPRLGSGVSSATFDLEGAIDTMAGDVDFTQMVTTGYVPGNSTSSTAGVSTRLIGVSTTVVASPGLALEITDRTSVSNKSQKQLDALATSYVSTFGPPVERWTTTLHPVTAPIYGDDYTIGDVVTMSVAGSPWLPDGDYLRRVVGVNGYTVEAVTLETTAVPA